MCEKQETAPKMRHRKVNAVTFRHALIAPLAAFFCRLGFVKLLLLPVFEVSFHRQKFRIVSGNDGIPLLLQGRQPGNG